MKKKCEHKTEDISYKEIKNFDRKQSICLGKSSCMDQLMTMLFISHARIWLKGITIQPMKLAVGLELIPVYRIKPQAKKATKYTWIHSSCYELAKMPWKWINKRNERSNAIKWSNASMLYMFSCCLPIGFCTLKCFVVETRERWNRIDAFALFTLLK